MSYSFSYDFEEISVMVDGRGRLASGSIDVTYNRFREYDGSRYFEIDAAPVMTITEFIDDETEQGVPCVFTLTDKTATYDAILQQLESGRYTLADAASDHYTNEW